MRPQSQPNPAAANSKKWNYVEVEVRDDKRSLRPTHVCSTDLIFKTPPAIASKHIEIIVTNNGQPHSRWAVVLPHDPDATQIPIQLIDAEESALAARG